MKLQSMLLAGMAALALALPARAELITFDSLTDNGRGSNIPNGYAGLNWLNLNSLNVAEYPAAWNYYGPTGYPLVEQSTPNVAINTWDYESDITAPTGTFNLDSGYFIASVRTVELRVLGYRGNTLAFDNTFDLNQSTVDQLAFDYTGITRASFVLAAGDQFAMDNLTVDLAPAPEPGQMVAGVVLAGLGLAARRLGQRKGNQQS